MIVLFIVAGGFIIHCVINPAAADTYCTVADFKTFGALVSAGVLEMIFEFKGLIAIFRKRNDE